MAFLRTIQQYIKRYKNRDFHTSLQKEKKQKYLFRDTENHSGSSRSGNFRKPKNKIHSFSNFLQPIDLNIKQSIQKQSKALGIIGATLLVLCGYIFLYSPYFQITPSKVLIEATNEGIDLNMAYRAVEDIYGQNVFFFNEERLAYAMQRYQRNISHISIHRLYPNGLKISLSSYPIVFQATIIGIDNKKWGISSNGILIPSLQIKTLNLKPLEIYNDSNPDEFLDYKEIVPDKKMLAIQKILQIFSENWSDLKVTKIQFLEKENEVHLNLESGTKIFLALQDFTLGKKDPDIYKTLKQELNTLKVYIDRERGNILKPGITYLDVRIPGKIFLCREKGNCEKNMKLIYGENYR